MKNQYFGDRRDYFKYDVLERLASELLGVERLTCLWMLTPSDHTGQGQVPFLPDHELPRLTDFFQSRLASGDPSHRRVGEMRAYFRRLPFEFVSHRDDRDDFGPATRGDYFISVPDEALRRAVVFFDPDVGMEPATVRVNEKHLLFEEVSRVLMRMDEVSVAVIFQFARRVKDFWSKMANEFLNRLHRPLTYIAEPSWPSTWWLPPSIAGMRRSRFFNGLRHATLPARGAVGSSESPDD